MRITIYLILLIGCLGSDSKTGISVSFSGSEGTDWAEEYPYHDKLIFDEKIVYIKGATEISMAHNERNMNFTSNRVIVGADGGGIIRYKIDRDRQYYQHWADSRSYTKTALVLPAYSAPFALDDLTYDGSTPVVGTVGDNGGDPSSKSAYYYRGILDTANVTGSGDEYHVFSFADDSNVECRAETAVIDGAFYADDGKVILFVVNPKTPCFTASVTGTGQFYTTPAKAPWTPKICAQTTYISPGASGTVSITLRDINGNNVFYRIGGGAYTDAGASFVILDDTDFSDGSNTLEYYYSGNSAFTKTRTVVKNPTHPSLAEDHGNYLWGDTDGYNVVLSRITRAPYKSTYDSYKTNASSSGQSTWDTWEGQGYRMNGVQPNGYIQNISYTLKNAFVALVEGWSYTRAGAPKSHGEYAKEMLLENSNTIYPLGVEMNTSSDAVPSREVIYRGYYDSNPTLQDIFAYDIIASNFRSDQVTGGLTPIEDYFVRDCFGRFAFVAMQYGASMNGMNSPGMWGGARMMSAVSVGIVMSEYTSPCYGTSGFGTVQTKYPLCPYPDDQYTWKEALFDGNKTKSAYPNLTWYTGISDNGIGNSLFFEEGETAGGHTYPLGTWIDKASYFSSGLMGRHMSVWANMVGRWLSFSDSRLAIAIVAAADGSFIGAKDTYPQTGQYRINLAFHNSLFPDVAAAGTAYIQGLSPTDNNSDDKGMNDAGVFGFAWYDDTYYGEAGADTTPPTPSTSTWSVAPFASGDGIAGTATTSTDATSSPVAYRFSVVTNGSAESWGSWQELDPVLARTGLTPSTAYDVRVQVRDSVGNLTTASTIATLTTNAASTRTYTNPRNRLGF